MAEKRVQDYTENNDEGHVDTREKKFECETPDENLGCDMGIDVHGYAVRQSFTDAGNNSEPQKAVR